MIRHEGKKGREEPMHEQSKKKKKTMYECSQCLSQLLGEVGGGSVIVSILNTLHIVVG